jgi:toxin HigB-1
MPIVALRRRPRCARLDRTSQGRPGDATTDRDLRVPPSNHFEKLRGDLAGLYSIRVNQQWRLIFRWDGKRGEAADVHLGDHSYR